MLVVSVRLMPTISRMPVLSNHCPTSRPCNTSSKPSSVGAQVQNGLPIGSSEIGLIAWRKIHQIGNLANTTIASPTTLYQTVRVAFGQTLGRMVRTTDAPAPPSTPRHQSASPRQPRTLSV